MQDVEKTCADFGFEKSVALCKMSDIVSMAQAYMMWLVDASLYGLFLSLRQKERVFRSQGRRTFLNSFWFWKKSGKRSGKTRNMTLQIASTVGAFHYEHLVQL